MNTFVLYHANCFDGFGAAYAAWKHFGDKALYMAAHYDDKLPSFAPGSEVYMLDYSRKAQEMIAIVEGGARLEVIDHHKTAAVELDKVWEYLPNSENFRYTFNIGKSGAVLAWERFHFQKPVPQLLLAIQDGDLWKFEMPETKRVRAALSATKFDFEVWDELIASTSSGYKNMTAVVALLNKGRAILDYQEILVERFCEQATLMEIGGYYVPVVNTSLCMSEVGHRLLELYPDAKFAAYRYYRKDGVLQVGLRGRGDFDVSEIAKMYGGGGHENSAGFEVKEYFPIVPALGL